MRSTWTIPRVCPAESTFDRWNDPATGRRGRWPSIVIPAQVNDTTITAIRPDAMIPFLIGRTPLAVQLKKGDDSRKSYACFSAAAQSPACAFLTISWRA